MNSEVQRQAPLRGFHLFTLYGFEVKLDLSWLLLALLISWSLGAGWFPARYPELSVHAYAWMGISVAVGVFFSIVFHEFSHSMVARHYGLPIRGITLFIFGGEIIHAFAFTLIIGVLVGTYSSIFVASTTLLELGVSKFDLLAVEKEGATADSNP